MSNKQIFATLEIADHEIRLIVSEFHNLKFNVMKVERVEADGVVNQRIADENSVISGIKKAIANASRMIGVPITRVLLTVPSLGMRKYSKRITVKTSKGKIAVSDIQKAIRVAIDSPLDEDVELVNFICVRYIANGFTTRRLPLNENAETVGVDIELLCANRKMVYEYAHCVEQAGLEITDICLDSYAICSEASLFEKAIGKYVLMLKLERQTTTLTLLANGKIEDSVVINAGYGHLISRISEQFGLPLEVAARLLQYNCRLNHANLSDSPIYLWSLDSRSQTVSEAQLVEAVRPHLLKWIEELKGICDAIIDSKQTIGILCGEGAEIADIVELFADSFSMKFKSYIPETLGVRSSAMTACAGALYCYKDQEYLRKSTLYSVDEAAFNALVGRQKEKERIAHDDTLSNRLKRIFR